MGDANGLFASKRLAQWLDSPASGKVDQFTVAVKLIDFMFVAWQHANDGVTRATQTGNRCAQAGIVCCPGRLYSSP